MTDGGPYQRNTPINLVERFWVIDPLTGAQVLADPTTVTFTIKDPDDVDTSYVFGVDTNVTNPEVGVYICLLTPPLPTGIYHWACDGEGAVQAHEEDVFEVVASAVLPPESPNVAVTGPCSAWISGQDVANCTRVAYDGAPWLFDKVAFEASAALYEISGRKWPGGCVTDPPRRPARGNCSCWSQVPISYGMGPWFWTGVPWGFGGAAWAWYNERGDRLGCAPMSRVLLAGYPVQEVVEVTIDGDVLPRFDPDTGLENWRLDERRYLTRMDTGGANSQPRFWPGCQNMSLAPSQPGTFAVTYRWGAEVPQLGRDAAVEIANQLYLACGGRECALPAGVTRVTRQGIEIERGLLANWADPKKPTGLVNTDLFLMAYWKGGRGGRVSAVWSPDRQTFARPL